jgi:hypothetical protein
MTSEEELLRRIDSRSDDERIADHLSLINDSFGDVLSKYMFTLKTKTIDQISFESDNFELRFIYERNRYGVVGFDGIMVGVKSSRMEYSLSCIIDILDATSNDTFDYRFHSRTDATGVQICRDIWNDYIYETFKDPNPEWEKEVSAFLKQRSSDFF